MIRRALLAGAICAVAAGASAPEALAEVEPNNAAVQAEGPLSGATTYGGTLFSDADVDQFLFYAASQQQIDIAVPNSDGNGCAPAVTLSTLSGQDLSSVIPDPFSVAHLRYTTAPGKTPYLVRVEAKSCDRYDDNGNERVRTPYPNAYSFSIGPGQAVIPGPPINTAPIPVPEPNETLGSAYRITRGDTWYGGVIAGGGDSDYVQFTSTGAPFEVQVGTTDQTCDMRPTLYRRGYMIDQLIFFNDSAFPALKSFRQRAKTPAVYQVGFPAALSGTGCTWQLRVTPAKALKRPLTRQERCLRARARSSSTRKSARRAARALHRSRARRARARAKRLYRTRLRAYRHARTAQRRSCRGV